MEVRVSVSGGIVVDDDVDTLDVDTTTKDVGGDEDTLLEGLELLETRNTLWLGKGRVDADGGEVALLEKGVELGCALDRLDKDTDLVELEVVEEVVELAVLLAFLELEVVLLETMEGELGLVVDVDFQGLRVRCERWSGLRSA